MDGYRDSEDMILKANYDHAMMLMEQGEKAQALMIFVSLGVYQDASAQKTALWDQIAVRDTISAGYDHTVGLKADGTVVAVGDNRYGRCDVSDWRDIVAISAGSLHTALLKSCLDFRQSWCDFAHRAAKPVGVVEVELDKVEA